MARSVQIIIEDDLNGGLADETLSFSIDGSSYEIDLSAKNAAKLRAALQPYVDGGRKVRGRAQSATRRAAAGKNRSQEIRAWAEANGIAVSARGRVSADVIAKYDAAHS